MELIGKELDMQTMAEMLTSMGIVVFVCFVVPILFVVWDSKRS